MTQVNQELYESARIDGANLFHIVKSIIIPLLKPTHIALLILGVIGTLKTFDIIYLTTRAAQLDQQNSYLLMFFKGILEFKASCINNCFNDCHNRTYINNNASKRI